MIRANHSVDYIQYMNQISIHSEGLFLKYLEIQVTKSEYFDKVLSLQVSFTNGIWNPKRSIPCQVDFGLRSCTRSLGEQIAEETRLYRTEPSIDRSPSSPFTVSPYILWPSTLVLSLPELPISMPFIMPMWVIFTLTCWGVMFCMVRWHCRFVQSYATPNTRRN